MIDVHDKIFGGKPGGLIKGRVPTILLVNVMIPDYPPEGGIFSLLPKIPPDGPGHTVTMVCMIAKWAREIFEETEDWSNLPPELSLLVKYVEGLDGEDGYDPPPHQCATRKKTKFIVAMKGGQHNLPWPVRMALHKGNAKPFLTDRTGHYVKRKGCFEIDVDGHNFRPIATNSLRTCHGYFKYLILDCAAVIQGENDKELPERLLTSCRISYPDLEGVSAAFENIEPELKDRKWISWKKICPEFLLSRTSSERKRSPLRRLRTLSLVQPKANSPEK